MIGLLFSGQGAQRVGLTYDIYKSVPLYRNIIDNASNILNIDLSELMFDSNKSSVLSKTEYAQPAIFTMSYALYSVIQKSITYKKIGLGLSLGEYSALAAAKNLDFKSALKLIKVRGKLMQEISKQVPSSMIAVLKSSLTEIESELAKVKHLEVGEISISNINTPEQIVIGGEKKAIDVISQRLIKEGKIVIPLKVTGAFHTPIMQPIQRSLELELQKIHWKTGKFPVYSTTTFQKFTPNNIAENLTSQLVSTTYFSKTLIEHSKNLNAVIEVGPGKTLVSFASKTIKDIPTFQTDSMQKIEETVSVLEKLQHSR